MRSQLLAVDGVEEVEVDVAAKTATVTAGEDVDPASVAGALKDGFSGTVRKPSDE